MKWDREWVELGERGALDPIESWEGKRAVLVFAKDGLNSKIVPVTEEDLAKILTGDRSVPLVVLNEKYVPGDVEAAVRKGREVLSIRS